MWSNRSSAEAIESEPGGSTSSRSDSDSHAWQNAIAIRIRRSSMLLVRPARRKRAVPVFRRPSAWQLAGTFPLQRQMS
eukprot:scaffold7403_cov277-Pinguiococcus_pyrenoidosus.AAC.6